MSEPRDPASTSPPGDGARIVAGRYRLGAVLGRGGMATVHRATDIRLGREVAVKLLRPEVTTDRDLAQRFRREALAATVLRHPNIVPCLDTGTDGDQPFLVMELVDGEDLAARLRRGGRLAPAEAARIGLEVARALGVAHVRGIVHRDIKPGNILLTADGRARVTDFGIARLAMDAEAALPGTTLGSVHYFSPEQARGATTTPASDVYGLGLVMYEALTGSRPWSGETTDAIALARVGATAPSVRDGRPEIPRALAEVVARALSPEAADRYPSGAAMAAALEPIVAAGDRLVDEDTTVVRRVAPPPPPVVAALARPNEPAAPALEELGTPPGRPRRGHGANAVVTAVAVVGVILGAMAVAALPGARPGDAGDVGPSGTSAARPDPTPGATPALASSAPSADPATPRPTREPTEPPTPVPAGEVADICETFLDLPCGLGAGRYAPSRFSPPFDIEIGDGWSALAHQPDVVVFRREEGYLTFISGVTVVDPLRAATEVRGRARDLVEALVTMDGVGSTPPADVRIGGRRGLSIDLSPLGGQQIGLFATADSTYYLEPDHTTRIVVVDVRDEAVILAIEPVGRFDLRAILDSADVAAGTIRWR
ncbi:MAG: protein kinase [Chloroflexota bacterium]